MVNRCVDKANDTQNLTRAKHATNMKRVDAGDQAPRSSYASDDDEESLQDKKKFEKEQEPLTPYQ